ncbi:hypothetical protein [Clostridium botulinum]
MKLLAVILLISCLIDIILPIVKVVKGIIFAIKNNIEIDKKLLSNVITSEILNFLAVIFFMLFITNY